jgi:hypothetical protein
MTALDDSKPGAVDPGPAATLNLLPSPGAPFGANATAEHRPDARLIRHWSPR